MGHASECSRETELSTEIVPAALALALAPVLAFASSGTSVRAEIRAAFTRRAVFSTLAMLVACALAGWASLHWAAWLLERVGPAWVLPLACAAGALVVRSGEALTARGDEVSAD